MIPEAGEGCGTGELCGTNHLKGSLGISGHPCTERWDPICKGIERNIPQGYERDWPRYNEHLVRRGELYLKTNWVES